MKRLLSILTASVVASSLIGAPALAQGNSGNAGNGNSESSNGNGPGNSGDAGNGNANGMGADNASENSAAGVAPSRTEEAPGQVKGDGESAKAFAPGQIKNGDDVDDDTTASTGQPNFGTVISSIRAGKSDLSGLSTTPQVNFIDVDDLISGGSRAALDNALEDSQVQIGDLQDDLRDLNLGLTDTQLDAAVAAQVDADGNLTVFTD